VAKAMVLAAWLHLVIASASVKLIASLMVTIRVVGAFYSSFSFSSRSSADSAHSSVQVLGKESVREMQNQKMELKADIRPISSIARLAPTGRESGSDVGKNPVRILREDDLSVETISLK